VAGYECCCEPRMWDIPELTYREHILKLTKMFPEEKFFIKDNFCKKLIV